MSDILLTYGLYFGKEHIFVCDLQCDKAWGINNRPRVWIEDKTQTVYPNEQYHDIQQNMDAPVIEEIDNYFYLADSELGIASKDTGIYEGGEGKPIAPVAKHNKWCVRECERCGVVALSELRVESEVFHDYSNRCYNMSQKNVGGTK